jgi:hypothetical protein
LVCSITSYACEVWVGLQKNRSYWSSVSKVLQVPARGAKNNQHIHCASRIWQIPLWTLCMGISVVILWAQSLKTTSWERHGKPNLLCLLREIHVGLDPWKNGYSRINPRRW